MACRVDLLGGVSLGACLLVAVGAARAQETLKVLKVDPPNWYATLPKPMLLVRGEGLTGATFRLSDPALQVERTTVSANGHWAQVWLSASPAKAETVQLEARRGREHVEQPYTFQARRAAGDGMAGFSAKDVMYLIVTDRFADGDLNNDGPLAHSAAGSPEAAAERARPRGWHGGDLHGIGEHLDYLQELGVTTVWPTPVYQNHSPEAYHGYSTTDYYAVDEHYGSMAELQALARKLHARGMKLVLDTVPNHVGPHHPWVTDEPAPDWFHGTAAEHHKAEYDFKALVDPHSTEHARVGTLTGWFANVLPDMNTDSPAVAQYLRQNVAWWIEQTGADGLRIDTYAYVNRGFWQAYDAELKARFPQVTEVGEVYDGDPTITSFFAGGRANTAADGTFDTGLYTPFDFPSYFALRAALTGSKPMTTIPDTLRADMLYPAPDRLVTFMGNHDTKRLLSEPGADAARVRMGYGLLATMRGTPQIYYGDELAMTGGDDPDNRQDMPGGFAGLNDFAKAGLTPDQQAMHAWVSKVFALRKSAPALQSGEQQEVVADAETFGFVRQTKGAGDCLAAPGAERYLVVLNVDKQAKTIDVDPGGTWLAGCTRMESVLGEGVRASRAAGALRVDLPAETIGVFRVRR